MKSFEVIVDALVNNDNISNVTVVNEDIAFTLEKVSYLL